MNKKNWLPLLTALFTFNVGKKSIYAQECQITLEELKARIEMLKLVKDVTRTALLRNDLPKDEIEETINLIRLEDLEGKVKLFKSNERTMKLGTNDWTTKKYF